MFSILDRTSEPSPVAITESTLQSLNLSFLGEASGISYMERYLTADTETIRYRQALFADIAEHPELISFFDELHEKIENILFCEKMGREANVANENGDILSSFRELMFFTECIDLIAKTGEAMADTLRCESLKELFDRAKSIAEQDWYENAKLYTNEVGLALRDIKSVTIGINFDTQLRPLEAGIVSLNDQRFSTNTLFDKLFAKKMTDKNYICIAPITSGEIKAGGVPMQMMNSKLYEAMNAVVSRSLKKIKSTLHREFYTAVSFLTGIADELKFISACSLYILSMKAKGLPLCVPEIAEDTLIIDNYNPSLSDYLESREIVKNDVIFDQNGRIWIITGPNSGGKSVFLRAAAIAQILFQLGLPVPGKKARMQPCTAIFAHFSSKVSDKVGGRFENECKNVLPIYKAATSDSLILLDELFSSTSTYEGGIVAEKILRHFAAVGCRCIYTTHIHSLSP